MADIINGSSTTTVDVGGSFFTNYPLISAIIAFSIAQGIKFLTSWYKENRWDIKQLVGSGGMPSSHSATVTALAVAIGLHDGFGGSLFGMASILACVVMYDATGVRLHAGRQAEVLNQIVCELPAEHPLAESRPLRELLGHTPTQYYIYTTGEFPHTQFKKPVSSFLKVVAGAILGLFTSTFIHLCLMI